MRFSERRLEVFIGANVGYIIEIMDQWYGPGYRYVKVRGHDGSVYLLRLDEINDPMRANHVLGGARPTAGNANNTTWLSLTG